MVFSSPYASWRLAAAVVLVGCSGAGADRAERGAGDAAEHLLRAGTAIELRSSDSLTSRHNHAGDVVTAVSVTDARDASGAVVVPAGAVFVGTVQAIAPAENPGETGTLSLAFTRVRINGHERPIRARVASLATRMQGRGVTAGDVGKVGAGTVIGGVAGRLIGGNRTGTIVGAAAGTAAGAAYAHATRDIDIVLPRGAAIRLVLTGPFPATAGAGRAVSRASTTRTNSGG